MNERFEKIANARVQRDLREQSAKQLEMDKKTAFCTHFKAYGERIRELIAVAKELQRNGFLLGEKPDWSVAPRFVSCGIRHRFGFIVNGNPFTSPYSLQVIGIGYEGGGVNGRSFIINEYGVSQFSEYVYNTMNTHRIDSDFDAFEREFYKFVDNL